MKKVFLVFMFVLTPFIIFSQASWIDGYDHGLSISAQTEIRDDVEELRFQTIYTLGGKLDLGAGIDIRSPLFIGSENYTLIGYIIYGFMPIKQSAGAPFSFRISGTYGFTNSSSPYYDTHRLNKTGRGFNLQLGFFYDIPLRNWLKIRTKIFTRYKNYLYTTTLNYQYDPPEEELPPGAFDPSIYPVTERETSWIFGPALGFQFFLNDSSSIILETELRITPEGTLTVAPSLGAAFGN